MKKIDKRKAIESLVVFLIVWLLGIFIHQKFLNLDYEILRSFIVGIGTGAMRYVCFKD